MLRVGSRRAIFISDWYLAHEALVAHGAVFVADPRPSQPSVSLTATNTISTPALCPHLHRLRRQTPRCSAPSPPQTAPIEREKNGLHLATIQEDEDAMLVDQDEPKDATSAANATTGVATNLSMKKATPPQPSAKKQLVIKLVKAA